MNYEHLLVEIGDDFVGEITLNRPEQLNAFNSPLAGELVQALKELDTQTTVRVILLKGAGKAFCAGIDVNELAGKTAMEYKAWVEHMEKPLITISRMSKPVIAQVQGVAAANGAGLVAAADLAIATCCSVHPAEHVANDRPARGFRSRGAAEHPVLVERFHRAVLALEVDPVAHEFHHLHEMRVIVKGREFPGAAP